MAQMQTESTDYDNVYKPNDIVLRHSQQEPVFTNNHQSDNDTNNVENFKPFLNPLNPLNHIEKRESSKTKYFSWGKNKKSSFRNSGVFLMKTLNNFLVLKINFINFLKGKSEKNESKMSYLESNQSLNDSDDENTLPLSEYSNKK